VLAKAGGVVAKGVGRVKELSRDEGEDEAGPVALRSSGEKNRSPSNGSGKDDKGEFLPGPIWPGLPMGIGGVEGFPGEMEGESLGEGSIAAGGEAMEEPCRDGGFRVRGCCCCGCCCCCSFTG